MHKRASLLVLLVMPFAAAAALAASPSTPPPGASYVWVQPWTVSANPPCEGQQPPARIPIAAPVVNVAVPGSSYEWTQPGSAPANVPCDQPPAWVPIS